MTRPLTHARVFAAEDVAYYIAHRLPFIADAGRLVGECNFAHRYTVRSGRTVLASGDCFTREPLTLHDLPPTSPLPTARRHARIVREALSR